MNISLVILNENHNRVSQFETLFKLMVLKKCLRLLLTSKSNLPFLTVILSCIGSLFIFTNKYFILVIEVI